MVQGAAIPAAVVLTAAEVDAGCDAGLDKGDGEPVAEVKMERPELVAVPGLQGVGVVDLSNMEHPKRVAVADVGVSSAMGGATIVGHGSHWYFGGGLGIAVVDASNPRDPTSVHELNTLKDYITTEDGGVGLAIDHARKVLYAASGLGLSVFDLGRPGRPQIRVQNLGIAVLCPASAGSIVVADDYLFVGGGKGMATVDVSDPNKPVLVSKVSTGVATRLSGCSLALHGQRLYVSGAGGLALFDVSTPAEPKRLASTKVPLAKSLGGAAVAVAPEGVVLVSSAKGVCTFDGDNLRRLGEIALSVTNFVGKAAISIIGSFALVVGSNGLAILDIADPAHLRVVSRTDIGLRRRIVSDRERAQRELGRIGYGDCWSAGFRELGCCLFFKNF